MNYFLGWSQEDLERELRLAQTDFAQGKSTTAAGDGNVLVKNQIDTKASERIRRIYLALNKLAPIDYPLEDIIPITSAKIVFG